MDQIKESLISFEKKMQMIERWFVCRGLPVSREQCMLCIPDKVVKDSAVDDIEVGVGFVIIGSSKRNVIGRNL